MILTKRFYNHKGVDLRSSDLIRPEQYASDMLNAQYSSGGALEKRTGYQACADSAGGYGLFTYRRYNPTTGVDDPRVLTIDQNLYELTTSSIEITYSGADPTCFLTIFTDGTEYKLQIIEGDTTVLDQSLGIGFDEASPYTISDLATDVTALTNFTGSVTGTGSIPAAFLDIVREADLTSTSYTGTVREWSQVNSTVSNPLSSYYANRNNSNHENVSSVQVGNVIYFGTGYDETYKYDGQTFYRAGLPTPGALNVSLSAGAITGTNYIHRIQYAQYDAAGSIVEGNLTSSTAQNPTAQQFDLTVPNIQAGTGFNTDCAIVNGVQAGVTTITVDDGSGGMHTMKVGDTAYFYDGSTSAYVQREVTAIGATTITIAGAAVDVADNAVISNNLRILIWRSKSSAVTPTAFYFIDEIPNDSFSASQSYTDNNLDSALGELLLEPATDRSPPPKGKYVSQWNGQMVIGGDLTLPTSLTWSDIDSPEYFPSGSNQIFIEPGNGDVITGIAPNNEVFTIHGNLSFTVISGDLSTGQIRVETRARDVGCAAHSSITDVDGILVWLSPNGPRQSTGGQVPIPLGPALDPSESNESSRIDPAFDNDGKVSELQLQLKRAIGFNDSKADRWLLYVPAESPASGNIEANSNSRLFVYDRVRDAWLIWASLNAAGGMTINDDQIYFAERRFSNFESAIQSILYRRHNLIDAYDYADNTASIALDYSPQWEFLNEPSVLKDAICMRVFTLELTANNQFTLTIDQEVNFQNDSSIAQFSIDVSGGGYGYTAYGTDAYGDPIQDGYLHPLSRTRLRSVRPRYRNENLHENVSVTGWELEFSTPYRPEFKS